MRRVQDLGFRLGAAPTLMNSWRIEKVLLYVIDCEWRQDQRFRDDLATASFFNAITYMPNIIESDWHSAIFSSSWGHYFTFSSP